jgi:hypothetical protein
MFLSPIKALSISIILAWPLQALSQPPKAFSWPLKVHSACPLKVIRNVVKIYRSENKTFWFGLLISFFLSFFLFIDSQGLKDFTIILRVQSTQ